MKEKRKLLVELKKKMLGDDSLPLKKTATNLVFADGSASAEIMFIGEGPGYWEDQKGIPFVGNAGAFLDQLLAQIDLPRRDVFITNVIHYRPPNNRDPLPEELAAFKPYLDKMIEIINPKLIVTLGRFSMAKFLPGVTITNVHGSAKTVNWKGRELIILPMYHPAAGLRNGEVKRRTIEDFKKIPEILQNLDQIETGQEENAKDKTSEQMQLV